MGKQKIACYVTPCEQKLLSLFTQQPYEKLREMGLPPALTWRFYLLHFTDEFGRHRWIKAQTLMKIDSLYKKYKGRGGRNFVLELHTGRDKVRFIVEIGGYLI